MQPNNRRVGSIGPWCATLFLLLARPGTYCNVPGAAFGGRDPIVAGRQVDLWHVLAVLVTRVGTRP